MTSLPWVRRAAIDTDRNATDSPQIFGTSASYRRDGTTGLTSNAEDGIPGRPGMGAYAETSLRPDGIDAAMVIGVAA